MKLSRTVVACLVYAVLHVSAQISAEFFEVGPGISIWYPPSGLALSLLVLLGPRFAPVVFLTNVFVAWGTSDFAVWWAPLLFPALITANYTGAAWLARRYLGTKLLPGATRETLIFSGVILASPAAVAFAGSGVLLALGHGPSAGFLKSTLDWWVGDASGLLTVVPVAMVFVRPWLEKELAPQVARPSRSPKAIGVIVAQAVALIGLLWLVFAVKPLPSYNAFYLCFLPLTWICLHQGLRGATLATLAITMGSLMGMHLVGSSTTTIVGFLLFELTVVVVGLGLGSAVSRRNEAERKLAASEARFDRVISGAQLGLWDVNVPDCHTTFNDRCAAMLGYAREEIEPIHTKWPEMIHPDDRERVGHARKEHIERRSPLYEVEYRVRTRDHHWKWIHSRGSVVTWDAANQPLQVSGTHLDITARKSAEGEAGRLLEIIGATTDFVLTTDSAGQVLYANRALLELLGHQEFAALQPRLIAGVFDEATTGRLKNEVMPAALKTNNWHGELILRDKEGREVHVSLVALAHRDEANDVTTLSFVMRDITPQKLAEAERIEHERRILQIQKAESLGVLAGGIAHDFNNLLTAMLGNANLARFDLPPESPLHHPLTQIENAATRAAVLCQQMLAYAGRSPLSVEEVDLNALIGETRQLLQVSIGKKVQVDLQLAKSLAPIKATPAQIQQVIMNLTLNASEAIGDKDGCITIKTETKQMGSAELNDVFRAPSLPTGRYVMFEIQDTGCGIQAENLSRIFEPFYTTKFTGHGLGLAAAMGIVKAHKGAIHAVSRLGVGSTFRVLFPATTPSKAPFVPSQGNGVRWRESGLVLVVDDEPSVRTVSARMLESYGFTVVTAVDGMDGVERFRQHAGELRLVLLDMTMPRMGGEEAFVEMHRINSHVPIAMMSGFTEELTLERFDKIGPVGFVAKPFTHTMLKTRLQALLGTRTDDKAEI